MDWSSRHPDEIAYSDVTDELNDPPNPRAIFKPLALEDLDPEIVEAAKRFAEGNGKNWPPEVGDFDRYYDWCMNDRKVICPRCNFSNTGGSWQCKNCGVDMSDLL